MIIYKITNTVNNKIYIGKTIHIETKRWSNHTSLLTSNSHYNRHLQSAWNKYGESSFKFEVVEKFDSEMNFDLDNLEKYWIRFYDSSNPTKGYNKTHGGEGMSPTDETRKKMSQAQKGRVKTTEECLNISKGKTGKSVHGLESRLKISAAMKGRVVSDETRRKLSEAAKQQWKKNKSTEVIGA